MLFKLWITIIMSYDIMIRESLTKVLKDEIEYNKRENTVYQKE